MLTIVLCLKLQIPLSFDIFGRFTRYIYLFCDHIRLILFNLLLSSRSNRFRFRILRCRSWKLLLNKKRVSISQMRAKTIRMTYRITRHRSILRLKSVVSTSWIDYSLTFSSPKPLFSNLIRVIINFINTKETIIILQQYLEIEQTTSIVIRNIRCSWSRTVTRRRKYSQLTCVWMMPLVLEFSIKILKRIFILLIDLQTLITRLIFERLKPFLSLSLNFTLKKAIAMSLTSLQINFKRVDIIIDERKFTFCVMSKIFKLNDDLNVLHMNVFSSLINYLSDWMMTRRCYNISLITHETLLQISTEAT